MKKSQSSKRGKQPSQKKQLNLLTPREMEVLQELGKDVTDKEIAVKLKITYSTVRFHKENLYKKVQTYGIRRLAKYIARMNTLSH